MCLPNLQMTFSIMLGNGICVPRNFDIFSIWWQLAGSVVFWKSCATCFCHMFIWICFIWIVPLFVYRIRKYTVLSIRPFSICQVWIFESSLLYKIIRLHSLMFLCCMCHHHILDHIIYVCICNVYDCKLVWVCTTIHNYIHYSLWGIISKLIFNAHVIYVSMS